MLKKPFKKTQTEYGYVVNYKRVGLKYKIMAEVADHYKSIKAKVVEDRETIMVYFVDGARLFMSKKSGAVQFYFIGTARFEAHYALVFESLEQLLSAFEKYREANQGTAIFSDVLSEIDKDEMDDFDDDDDDF